MDRIQAAWRAITEVVAAPGANLRPALLLGAVVFLFVVILLVAAVLVVAIRRERRSKRRARLLAIRRERLVAKRRAASGADGSSAATVAVGSPGVTPGPGLEPVMRVIPPAEAAPKPLTRAGRTVNVALTVWLPLAIVLVIGVVSYVATGSDRYCSVYCHGTDAVTTRRADTAHAGVPCTACHEDPAPLGIMSSVSTRLLHVSERVGAVATVSALPVVVPVRRCLACHSRELAVTVENLRLGVRMSHTEPLAGGMTCDDCHTVAGHATARSPVSMAQCIRCHDSVTAPAECATCHIGDTSTASEGRRVFAKSNVGVRRDCGGCHDQKKCDTCHGLRLPHPDAFLAGGHARQAAFSGKRLCFGCHTQDSCSACHLVPIKLDFAKPWGHPVGWETAHARGGRDSMCSCHEIKRPGERRGEPFCTACHAPGTVR